MTRNEHELDVRFTKKTRFRRGARKEPQKNSWFFGVSFFPAFTGKLLCTRLAAEGWRELWRKQREVPAANQESWLWEYETREYREQSTFWATTPIGGRGKEPLITSWKS